MNNTQIAALNWWNSMLILTKKTLCNLYFPNKDIYNLSAKEIQHIYKAETTVDA